MCWILKRSVLKHGLLGYPAGADLWLMRLYVGVIAYVLVNWQILCLLCHQHVIVEVEISLIPGAARQPFPLLPAPVLLYT